MATTLTYRRTGLASMMGTGSTIEALAGLGALVLSIIGLADVAPAYMVAIAAIVLGAGLLFEGGFIAAEYRKLLAAATAGPIESPAGVTLDIAELGGGLSAQSLAGIAAIVLGILGLLGIAEPALMAIGAIVLGVGILLGSSAMSRLNALRIEAGTQHETARQVAHEAMSGAIGTDALVGVAAIVLGILALIGIASQTLNLVAMLTLGSALLLSGSALAARVMTAFWH